jgi:rhodanese-related sulfurtransferase
MRDRSAMVESISALELQRRLAEGDALVVLDVREPEELEICRIPGSVHIPLADLPRRYHELDADASVVCVCHHGRRSAMAASLLAQNGFSRLSNLTGGIDAWAEDVDPLMARY